MNDEEVAEFALQIKIHSELLSQYLDDYENKLLLVGSVQNTILHKTATILHKLYKSLPENKLEEMLESSLRDMTESYYYRDEK